MLNEILEFCKPYFHYHLHVSLGFLYIYSARNSLLRNMESDKQAWIFAILLYTVIIAASIVIGFTKD